MPSPEHDQVVALLRAQGPALGGTDTVEASRERLDAMADLFPTDPAVVVEPVDLGGTPCERIVAPAAAGGEGGTIVYCHGGAYVAGSLVSHRSLCARISAAAGLPVVSVAYRLAPEHPHPAAVEDALAAYRALLAGGTPAERIVTAGDSAGGGLTAAVLVALRDAGEPLPAGAVLLSPWLDLTLSGASVTERAGEDPLLVPDNLRANAERYAGANRAAPLASPLFADLQGLPPLLILVGTAEVLLDDSTRFAERARAAGVPVDLDVEDGLVHVWPAIDGLPEADAAVARIAAWARDRLGLGVPSR